MIHREKEDVCPRACFLFGWTAADYTGVAGSWKRLGAAPIRDPREGASAPLLRNVLFTYWLEELSAWGTISACGYMPVGRVVFELRESWLEHLQADGELSVLLARAYGGESRGNLPVGVLLRPDLSELVEPGSMLAARVTARQLWRDDPPPWRGMLED